jgi:hypothetical protein
MKKILNIALLCASLSIYAMEKEEIQKKKDDYKIPLELDPRINKIEALRKVIKYSLVGAAIGVATERTFNQLFLSSEENSNKDNSWNYISTLSSGFLGALSAGAIGLMRSVFEQGIEIGRQENIERIALLENKIKNEKQAELKSRYSEEDLEHLKYFFNNIKINIIEKLEEQFEISLISLYEILNKNFKKPIILNEQKEFNEFFKELTCSSKYSKKHIEILYIAYDLKYDDSFYNPRIKPLKNLLHEYFILKHLINEILKNCSFKENENLIDIFNKNKVKSIVYNFLEKISISYIKNNHTEYFKNLEEIIKFE